MAKAICGVFPEYLGDISTELFLQNLTNTNRGHNNIDQIRLAVPGGFTVIAEIERKLPNNSEHLARMKHVNELIAAAPTEALKQEILQEYMHPPGKIVRLILEINHPEDSGDFYDLRELA
jgi:hypothetical protein